MSDHEDSRPPLEVAGTTPRWRVEVVEESPSTNAVVADRFRSGEGEGLVVAAEHQTAGRGRLGREWVTPARSSLTVSFLLVPEGAPAERWPWLPLLTGVAAAAAVRRVTGVEVALKWPNDVLADDHKLGGILLERVEHEGTAAAIVGIGINCHQSSDELPVPEATSLAIVTGGPVDRSALLTALVEELETRYDAWAEGADLRSAYLELCTTPGQQVKVAVPGGEVAGEAVDVDESGRLVVRTSDGEERLGAGDVVYVRPE
jgi:BirA family transcriptional regulator, biotin operon repressor / biotin---[acetyl-CoA-carboxylase] ligase